MTNELKVGLLHQQSLVIDEQLIVPAVSPHFANFSAMPPVFATAYLVGFVEWVCIEALKPYLAEGQHTVGTAVDLTHSAATAIGMKVTAEVELIEIKDKQLRFKVTCRDDLDVISQGFHERFIVDAQKFLERLDKKIQRFKAQ